MTNIILCGGNGTRLWPLSRSLMPKQFVKLFDGESLFQKTVRRNRKVCDELLVVSNAEQYFLAVDQVEELSMASETDRYLLEPVGRNTAPAIALACLAVSPATVVLVSPSDHLISEEARYQSALEKASVLAEQDYLVTFGIAPRYPETGFGYIEASGVDVRAFHEKPDAVTAQRYLDAGNYYWNSGMFCFKAGVFLEALKRHSPTIYEASVSAFASAKTDGFIRIRHEAMMAIPADSIDYAVMEKSDRVKVVPADMGWNDLGSFDALFDVLPKDADNNAVLRTKGGAGASLAINAKNNLIVSQKPVASVDVEDLCIVDTPDALLVSRRGSGQKVKEIVGLLKAGGSELSDIHATVHRPWGSYTVLDESDGYKVKHIVVKPGRRLSLQKHMHRSEHWVVVRGTATVTKGSDSYTLRANESTYIPMGQLHRLENSGETDLVMIEAQVGAYVGEDDIVRFDDDFKRE